MKNHLNDGQESLFPDVFESESLKLHLGLL